MGTTLYELLTLQRAFPTAEAIRDSEPIPPRRLNPGLDRDLEAVVLKTLQKDPERRYPTAGALAVDLEHWLRHEPVAARRALAPRRALMWSRRNKGWAAAIALFVLGLAAVAVTAVAAERNRHREALVQHIQRIRLQVASHRAGWSDDAWSLAREAVRTGVTDQVQGEVAATLAGLDARKVKTFDTLADALDFHPTTGHLLTVDSEGRVRDWDPENDTQHDLGAGRPGPFATRGDGGVLLLGITEKSQSLEFRDISSGKVLRTFPLPVKGEARFVAVSLTPDGRRAAGSVRTGDAQGDAVIAWDTGTGQVLKMSPVRRPTDVALTPDGRLLAVGDEEGSVRVWPLDDTREAVTLSAGRSRIMALTFGPDPVHRADPGLLPGTRDWLLATGDGGGMVCVWDLRLRIPRSYGRSVHNYFNLLSFSPDGMTLASAGPWWVCLWDVASGQQVLTIPANNINAGLAFSPDGRQLAVSQVESFSRPSRLTVWELDDGRGLRVLRGLGSHPARLAVSPDGRRTAAISNDWHVAVWDHAAGRLIGLFEGPRGSFVESAALAFSPDGKRLAVSAGHGAQLWDLDSGRLVRSWTLPEGLSEVLCFQEPDRLLSARQETSDLRVGPFTAADPRKYPRVVRCRNLLGPDPAQPLAEITEINIWIQGVHGSPDGSCVVVEGIAGQPGKLAFLARGYDWTTGKRLWELPTNHPASDTSAVSSVFDPTGILLGYLPGPNPGHLRHYFLTWPARTPVGWVDGLFFGPGAERAVDIRGGTPEEPPTVVLLQRGKASPILRVSVISGVDYPISDCTFSRDGRYVVWGNGDGSLTACDLPVVQRRLAALGLGW